MYLDDLENQLTEEELSYVDDVLDDGGTWGESDYRGNCKLYTRYADYDDCNGYFIIDKYGDNLGLFYHSDNWTVDINCGDVPEGPYDMYNLVEQAGTCPYCHQYVGIDNMEQVGWAGRACQDCAPAQKEDFNEYLRKYGTD